MLDALSFHDLVRLEDPDFRRSEAVCLAVGDFLDQYDDHRIVHVAALAHLIAIYFAECPARSRIHLLDTLICDIRRIALADA
jgi:hypothetical protein